MATWTFVGRVGIRELILVHVSKIILNPAVAGFRLT